MKTLPKKIRIEALGQNQGKAVRIPGSKSITNRALLLAALTKSPVVIKKPLISNDTITMMNALRTLGVAIEQEKNRILVTGNIFDAYPSRYKINADLSGTSLRFLLPILTIVPGIKILYGKEALNRRPLKDLVDALTRLGERIQCFERRGYPPVLITSSKIDKHETYVKSTISRQYLSALLMFLPLIGGGKIKVRGKLVSKPYVDLTLDAMHDFGVEVINKNYESFEVEAGQEYKATEYTVEGDYSSASYFAAIAALTGSTFVLENLSPDSLQGDMQFLHVLKSMGNGVTTEVDSVTIAGRGILPIDVDMQEFPDQIQTLAVLAAFAKGKTMISGISTLRVKETDRIAATRQELKKMGIKTEVRGNSLIVYGGEPKAAKINTYGDHRMAMSFAVASTRLPGIVINNPHVVGKSFPGFWEELEGINFKIKEVE